jgi:hypothetical protein
MEGEGCYRDSRFKGIPCTGYDYSNEEGRIVLLQIYRHREVLYVVYSREGRNGVDEVLIAHGPCLRFDPPSLPFVRVLVTRHAQSFVLLRR